MDKRKRRKRKKKTRKRLIRNILLTLTLLFGALILGVLMYGLWLTEGDSTIPDLPRYGYDVSPTSEPVPKPTTVPTPEITQKSLGTSSAPKILSVSFSTSEANRAAITAMTNYYALDVRNPDGSYDSSRFHNYGDTSGEVSDYLIYDWQTGVWRAVDSNTWHVDQLELHGADGSKRIVSLNVALSGEYYVITNLTVMTSTKDDTGPVDTGIACFWVPKERIEADRFFQ